MDTESNTSFERTCSFPVRFGRNDLFNVQLNYGFVSDQHATIDYRGGALFLIDHRSRNGTILSNGKAAPPDEAVRLTEYHNAFSIGCLRIHVELADTVDDELPNTEISTITGRTLTRRVEGVEKLAKGADTGALAEEVRPFVEARRRTLAPMLQAITECLSALGPSARSEAIGQLVRTFPELAHELDFRRLAEHYGAPLGARDREAACALQEARDVAEFFGAPPLKTVADIQGFFAKSRDVLAQFMLAFLPLRAAFYRPELEHTNVEDPTHHALLSARTPGEIAELLLDWKQPHQGARALRSTFATMLAHQVSLLNGVIRGTTELVRGLAPGTIEAAVRDGKHRASRRFSLGPWRLFWDEYRLKHSEIPTGDLRSFLHRVYGPEVLHGFETLVGQAEAEGRAAAKVPPSSDAGRAPARTRPTESAPAETSEHHGSRPRSGPMGTVVMPQPTGGTPSSNPSQRATGQLSRKG
ncbi:FHA domain-containing protein [Pendulispora albinea]|uniref:FHA domain-containing protein n=1 Tax=Pendulispora albinea TaxID=2741071 RepID=A0ABZ2LMM2_9BACT